MKKQTLDLLNKLTAAEDRFFSNENLFFCPVVPLKPVRVRIEGITLVLDIEPATYKGWGVFKPISQKKAQFVREGTLNERANYMALHPDFNAVVYHQGRNVKAVISQVRYKNIMLSGEIDVLLAENINQFDNIFVRWDGENFWYDSHNFSANLSRTEHLQRKLAGKSMPKDLDVPGITPAESRAYALAYESVRDKPKDRIENALKRSGGKLVRYTDRGNSYTVTYTINNREYTSTVNSKDLRVQSAGICLSGGDSNFDLQSLIHVISEGNRRGSIVVGDFANYNNRYDEEGWEDNDD